ncbi:MAG TPA: carboxypeptidase-like regulatory domain-containing protein [Arachnia sp.]|nr:carboxypeptidase-like regulatory domain-containing protein [Arachnia sp.]
MNHLRVILAILIALAVTGVGAPSASAAIPITGTVVHETSPGYYDADLDVWVSGDYEALSGVTVGAYAPSRSGSPAPKAFTSVVTDATGAFSLDIGDGPVCIKVEAPAVWQSGWVYGPVTDPNYPVTGTYTAEPPTCVISPGDSLGSVSLISAEAWGQVVNQNDEPIAGATVRYSPYDFSGRTWSTTTDVDGHYLIQGLDYEEFEVKVSAKKYLAGWVAASGDVVATWGEAATWGSGAIGTPDGQIRMTLR